MNLAGELYGSVEIVGGPAGLLAVAQIEGDGGLDGECTLDSDTSDAILLRSGRAQVTGLVIYLDGVRMDPSTYRSLSTSIARGDVMHRWACETSIPSPFGSLSYYAGGPPPGLRIVDVAGVYLTPSGLLIQPILSGGVVDNASAGVDASGVPTLRLEGLSRGARYDEIKVEDDLPPGHGRYRGAVVRRWAQLTGQPCGNIAAGGRMYKPAVLTIDDDRLARSRDLMAVDGLDVTDDRGGRLSTVVHSEEPYRRVDYELTDRHLALPITVTLSPATAPTRMKASGQAQVTRDNAEIRTGPPQIVDVYSRYQVKVATRLQQGAASGSPGAVIDSGQSQPPAPTEEILFSRTILWRTYRGDTLLSERSIQYGWYNPRAARYIQQADGSHAYPFATVYIYDEAAAIDDEAESFALGAEVWMVIGRSETTYTYDSRGFQVEALTRTVGPHMRRAAIQQRADIGADWEFIDGALLLGNGSGVADAVELMPSAAGPIAIPDGILYYIGQATRVERKTWVVTDDGFQTSETNVVSEYAAPAGQLYLYAGQDPNRSVLVEIYGELSREVTIYLAEDGDGSHAEVEVSTVNGVTTTTIRSGLESYLPRAERDVSIEPDLSQFTTQAERDAARAASRLESVAIMAEHIDYEREALFGRHEPSPLTVDLAETPEELAAILQREFAEAYAVQISVPLSFMLYSLGPGSVVRQNGIVPRLFGLPAGRSVRIKVVSVSWSQGATGAPTTEVSGLIYRGELAS